MLTFRVLDAGDFSCLRELFRNVFTAPPWNDGWDDNRQLEEYLLDLTDLRGSLSVGAFEDARLVAASLGRVMHWWSGSQYYIHEFFVDNRRQGSGAGTALLNAVEEIIKERQIFDIFLQTNLHAPAFRFYEKNGFTLIQDHVSLIKHI